MEKEVVRRFYLVSEDPPRNNAAKHDVSVCVGVLAGALIKLQMLLRGLNRNRVTVIMQSNMPALLFTHRCRRTRQVNARARVVCAHHLLLMCSVTPWDVAARM